MNKANYEKTITDSGEIIEMIGTYEEIENGIMNPPKMLSDKEMLRIIKIMKRNNIKKLDIII